VIAGMGFPGRYVQGPGALAHLGELLAELGWSRPTVVVDPAVAPLAAVLMADMPRLPFAGECSSETIAALAAAVPPDRDCLLAFGGGKTIDAAKGVARERGLPIVVCPSAASSDAPTSRLIVRYDAEHAVAGVDKLRRNPDAVVVDTDVIVRAPAHLFAAGIGDALSKAFEVRACVAAGGRNAYGYRATDTAQGLARLCLEVLLARGVPAMQAVRAQRGGADVEAVVEATVLLSGLGFESGGLSLAHALIRGLTTVPELAVRLHGELVAFGTLVQMAAMGCPAAEAGPVLGLMRAVGLPDCLAALGLQRELNEAQWRRLIEATLATDYSRHLVPALTPARLRAALDVAQAWATAEDGCASSAGDNQ
ncbi:probable alcohol dehydrogenase, partial [Bordetella avium 197N]